MRSVLDAVLLPKTFYKSMPVNKNTFLICILINGVFTVGYPFLVDHFRELFVDQPLPIILLNVLLSVVLFLVVGTLDSVAFCRPIADLFKFISSKTGGYKDPLLMIKTIKIYTLSALIVNPIYIFVSRVIFYDLDITSSDMTVTLYLFAVWLMQIWAFGIMSRGLSSVLRHKRLLRTIVFIVVGIWSMVWAIVFRSVFLDVLLRLYQFVPGSVL